MRDMKLPNFWRFERVFRQICMGVFRDNTLEIRLLGSIVAENLDRWNIAD